jgi:hypothetical protein
MRAKHKFAVSLRRGILRGVSVPSLHVKDYQRTTLSPRHRPVVATLAEAYFADGKPLPSERLLAFTDEVDRAISNASKTLRFGLRLMLDALRFAPFFMLGKLRLFEDLPLDERVRVLVRMERSRLLAWTIIFVAWKTLMAMIFFEDEEMLRDMGYPGPERTRYKLAMARE